MVVAVRAAAGGSNGDVCGASSCGGSCGWRRGDGGGYSYAQL